uniref:Uncharacterized protein n=1 Tax=Amphimedon queenslandica TaxID=400682 RepID=A0A1X7UE01_AMPQE
MHYAVKNRLSYKAVEDLIALMKSHCPSPNNLPNTFYELKKFVMELNQHTLIHLCSNCYIKLPDKKPKCNCCTNADICDLVLLSLEQRLLQLYEKHDNFQYPHIRMHDSSCLCDIYDGKAFQNLMAKDGFLSCSHNTGLVLSTDGVPVFKSSKGSHGLCI